MLILNIETSTHVGAVNLCRDGYSWIIKEEKETGDHAGQLTLFIEDVMKMAALELSQLDAIAVSAGPGSYTGLRIGVSVAKGICYALNKPLIAVDTLQAMAYAVQLLDQPGENDIIVSLQDARRMDAFAAVYDNKLNCIKEAFFLTLESDSFLDLIPYGGRLFVCGNAADKWASVVADNRVLFSAVKSPAGRYMEKLSADLFKAQKFEDTAYYEPFYLKPPNVSKPKPLL